MNAGRESQTHLRQPIVESPIRSHSRPLAGVAADPASSRPEDSPTTATGEDVLLRLALWLADVAAETAVEAAAGAPRRPGGSDDPPTAGSPS
jgi:hypothetical protein